MKTEDIRFDFNNYNCYHLVINFFNDEFGIEMKNLKDRKNIDLKSMSEGFREIEDKDLKKGDVLLFRNLKNGFHCAVMTNRTHMLHITSEVGTPYLEAFKTSTWKDNLIRAYRHESLL